LAKGQNYKGYNTVMVSKAKPLLQVPPESINPNRPSRVSLALDELRLNILSQETEKTPFYEENYLRSIIINATPVGTSLILTRFH
jgi:hypothetical protein